MVCQSSIINYHRSKSLNDAIMGYGKYSTDNIAGKNIISFCKWNIKVDRLDFLGGYLLCLSINYVAMSKDMKKRFPQLYYIKMKISYDLGFISIAVAMAT